MIYQAKANGASAILLITGILDDQTLKRYLDVAHQLGLSALVEARDETQVKRALASGARIIGVNNRDLRDFTVDIHNSLRYMELIPDDVVFVSESGIEKRAQTLACEEKGASAVLIGETFMKAPDQRAMLAALKGESHEN
jgi:indole-3-glycerol phosphate synthase